MKGADVKRLRLACGMSQQALAEYLGLSERSNVAHLESGRRPVRGPKLMLLKQLAKENGVTIKGEQKG